MWTSGALTAAPLGTDEVGVEVGEILKTEDPLCECININSELLLITFERVIVGGRLRLIEGTSHSTDNGTAEKGLVWFRDSRKVDTAATH